VNPTPCSVERRLSLHPLIHPNVVLHEAHGRRLLLQNSGYSGRNYGVFGMDTPDMPNEEDGV